MGKFKFLLIGNLCYALNGFGLRMAQIALFITGFL